MLNKLKVLNLSCSINIALCFEDFFKCIENKKIRKITKDQMFDVLKVCFAIEKSITSNKKIKVKYI